MAIVYKYGLLPPTEGAEHALSILTGAHALREQLVDVEIARRKAVRAAYRLDAEAARLEREAVGAGKAVKAVLERLRTVKAKRHLDGKCDELDAEKKRLTSDLEEKRAAEKEAIKAWSRARGDAAKSEHVKAAMAEAQAAADAAWERACESSAVPAQVRRLVEDAATQAFAKRPLYDFGWPNDPGHEEFDGSGRIAPWPFTKQTAGGIPVPSLFLSGEGPSTVQIGNAHPAGVNRRGQPRRTGKADLRVLRIRVAKDAWIAWPMVLHRPLPHDSRVLSVAVCALYDGDRIRWHATFAVETGLPAPSTAEGEVVVVDLGWRQDDDGALHVATLWTPDGQTERLVLSNDVRVHGPREPGEPRAGVIARLRYANKLREDSDRIFDQVIAGLCAWVKSLGPRAPEWLSEALEHAHRWHGHTRLYDLLAMWRERRFEADAEHVPELCAWMHDGDRARYGTPSNAIAALEAWQSKDHHLWIWERNVRSAAGRERQWIYRNFAARLARQYRTVVMADKDLAVAARKRKKNDDKTAFDAVRRNRFLAATSELRMAIEQAMVKVGGRVDKVPSPKGPPDASGDGRERCAAIYGVWQDPARKEEIKSVFAQKRESMWARLKRQKAEKLARGDGARKSDDKAAE